MAECQLPKLNTGVRFPSPAPEHKTAMPGRKCLCMAVSLHIEEELPMRKSMSRFFVCLLATALLCTQLTVGVFAVPPGRTAAGQAAAEELYELGLFLGSGTLPNGSPNFDLDRIPLTGPRRYFIRPVQPIFRGQRIHDQL